MISTWPCPIADGNISEELLVSKKAYDGDSGAISNILIIPPLFGEHNLMRRQLVLIMGALSERGHHSFLPDLPGWNESLQPLNKQSLAFWRSCMKAAAKHVNADYFLAVRSGTLLAPSSLPGCLYEPQSGPRLLRGMMRAQSISDRERGLPLTISQIIADGRDEGIGLNGWELCAQLFNELEEAEIAQNESHRIVSNDDVGSPGLWLRSEPSDDLEQAGRIADIALASFSGAR